MLTHHIYNHSYYCIMAIVPKWLDRIFAPAKFDNNVIESRATVTDSAWFQVLNGISGSGKVAAVTPRTAMSINAVYACVDLITRTKSSVRPKIYESNLTGKRQVLDHDQISILTRQANSYTGAIQWEKIWVMSYYIWGNGYAEIRRNGRTGRPVEYINLEPWLVFPEWLNGEKVYIYRPDGNGNEKAGSRVIKGRDMLHLADLSWNNLEGSSRISNNAGVINEYQNIANYGKQMYENGAQISGLVIANKPTSNESLELLRKSLDRFKNKNGEAWSVPFGFEYKPMTFNMPMADAELIEAKKMSIEDIARAFGVPLTLIQRGESADNKGDNEYNTFLGNVIMPLCLLMEEELIAFHSCRSRA